MRCFSFQDYQLTPTLEEYCHILGVRIKDQVLFVIINELPKSHHIAEALHLEKKEVELNLKLKGTHGFTSKFLVDKATRRQNLCHSREVINEEYEVPIVLMLWHPHRSINSSMS